MATDANTQPNIHAPVSSPTQTTGSQGTTLSPQVDENEGAFYYFAYPPKHTFVAFCRKWIRAYFGSLVGASIAFPIIAFSATLCFYFSPIFVLPFVPLNQSNWYAPVYGAVFALIATIIFAALRCYFATAEGANMHSYGLLLSRQSALKARLGIKDRPNGEPFPFSPDKLKQATGMTDSERCSESALREAYAAYVDVCHSLCYSHNGLQWVIGTGYTNTWEMIHRAEEALIEVVPIKTLVREAIDDQQAIKNSTINNRDDLLEKLIQAVKDLDPGASEYFKEHQPGSNYAEVQQELKEQQNMLAKLVEEYNKNHSDKISFDKDVAELEATTERRARAVLREVRHTLNKYRNNLREGLVEARKHLLISIALTGAFTYLLLLIAILVDPSAHSNKGAFLAAIIFYLVGAVAGLFKRFYDEVNQPHSGDDYSLSARLIAIPLLSGIAGVSGVLVTALLPLLSGQPVPGLNEIFTLKSDYLFAAAVFGFTPNLLMNSFLQRTQVYASKLKSSQAGGAVSDKK